MGFYGKKLSNNDNTVLAFSVGLLGDKYIRIFGNVFTCGVGNYSYKIEEFVVYYSKGAYFKLHPIPLSGDEFIIRVY